MSQLVDHSRASQSYKKVERKRFAHSVKLITPENQYWNSFKASHTDKLHTNVPFLRFSATPPYDCSICSSLDVRIFKGDTLANTKRLNFKFTPLVADTRADGRMIAIGGKNGLLRLYNNTSATTLDVMRSLSGHKGDVFECRWQPTQPTRLMSTGNDKTVRFWNISEPKQLECIQGHSDFVRSGVWLPSHKDTFLSGSYDHTVKLWDTRDIKKISDSIENTLLTTTTMTQTIHKSQLTFQHNAPVESVVAIPGSDLVAIAGGPTVSVWSIRQPNKPLTTVQMHRKTVTSLAVNREGTRLITGCLDNHVRVFETTVSGDRLFRNTHAFTTPSAVLSCDISNDGMMIAIGTLNDGIIFRTREGSRNLESFLEAQHYERDPLAAYDDDIRDWMDSRKRLRYMSRLPNDNDPQSYIRYGTRDWFLRGQKLKQPHTKFGFDGSTADGIAASAAAMGAATTPMIVKFKNRKKMKNYDLALKQFRYGDALDLAIASRDTITVHSVLDDLWRREGLETALGGRDANRLTALIEYCIYALPHPHLSTTTLHVAALIIDMYGSILGISPRIDKLFRVMGETVDHLVLKYKILLKLQGTIDMVLSAQNIHNNNAMHNNHILALQSKINTILHKQQSLLDDNTDSDDKSMEIDIDEDIKDM